MRFRDDERAQSVQIGAVLLFAMLVIAFSSYQAFVVPNQNSAVEFNHNQQIRDQMQDLRNEMVSMHGEVSTRSVTLTLGTRYPGRLVAVNPGPPSGTIRTVATGPTAINLSLANATASGETGDFWNGSERVYNTGSVVYQPNYNVYGEAPLTWYENSVLYNQFRTADLPASGQTLIDDDRISLVTVNGSVSQTRTGSTSLDLQPVSTSTRTVSVSNASDDENVTLFVPTQLPEDRWETLLEPQLHDNGGHVVGVDVQPIDGSPFGRLRIELASNESYQLRMTKIGLGTGVTDEEPAYLTDVAGNGTRLDVDDTTTVTLEVRDAYNNPISDARINASPGTGALSPEQTRTADGTATFTYDSTGVTGGQWVDLNFSVVTDPGSSFNTSTPQNVTMQVWIRSPPQASNGGGGGVYTTLWDRPPYGTARIASEELPAESDASAPFRMRVTDGGNSVSNVAVDYAVNNSSVATPAPATGVSNATGYNETGIVWRADGYLRAYTTTDATGDRVNVTVDRILGESFEDPAATLLANGWYYNDSGNEGDGGIETVGSGGAADGSRVAYISGGSDEAGVGDRAIERNYSLDTTGYDSLSLTYVAIENGTADDPDVPGSGGYVPDENLRAQYRSADGSWVTIDNVSSRADSGLPISYVRRATIENVGNASHDDFAIRFRQGATTSTDEWQIDSVGLIGIAVETRIADLNQDPIAAFDPPADPTAGQPSEFDAARSDDPDGAIVSYDWDFGDGATGSGVDPSHTYASTGTYTLALTVTDDGGETNTTTRTVTVSASTGGSQTEATPDEYDDTTTIGAPQNDSIPPVSPAGQLFGFTGLGEPDGSRATFTQPANDLSIGLAIRDIAAGSQTISLNYSKANNGENFEIVVVDQNGNEIDGGTTYTLGSKSGGPTFTLSAPESNYVDTNGDLYVLVVDTDNRKSVDLNVDDITVRVN